MIRSEIESELNNSIDSFVEIADRIVEESDYGIGDLQTLIYQMDHDDLPDIFADKQGLDNLKYQYMNVLKYKIVMEVSNNHAVQPTEFKAGDVLLIDMKELINELNENLYKELDSIR